MKLGAEHAAGTDLLVVLVMGGQLKIRFQLGAGRLAGLAIDKAALKTPAIALDYRHAQVVFSGSGSEWRRSSCPARWKYAGS